LTPRERAAIRFAEKLAVDHQKIDDALWSELRRQFSEAELIELVAHTTLYRLPLAAYPPRSRARQLQDPLAVQALLAHRARSCPRAARPRPTRARRTHGARSSVLLSMLPLPPGAPPGPAAAPLRPRKWNCLTGSRRESKIRAP
jgi:hypothetical protein